MKQAVTQRRIMSNLLIDNHTGMPAVCDYRGCLVEEDVNEIYDTPESKPRLRCPKHANLCNHDTDPYGTHKPCGKVATCDDEDFRFPMCEKHAQQAWACMQADDDMLRNAY